MSMWWNKKTQIVNVSKQAQRSGRFVEEIINIFVTHKLDAEPQEVLSRKYYDDIPIVFPRKFELKQVYGLQNEIEHNLKRSISIIYKNFELIIRVYKMDFNKKYYYKTEITNQNPNELVVTMGIGPEGPIRLNMSTRYPNISIASITGGGKGGFIKQLLCQIFENYPDTQAYYCDGKDGADAASYKMMKQMLGTADTLEGILEIVKTVEEERQRRQRKISKYVDKDGMAMYNEVRKYNADHPEDRIPFMILVLDEWALYEATGDKELDKMRSEFKTIVFNLTSKCRSAGIYCVISSQRIVDKVVPRNIIGNTFRIGMKVDTPQESDYLFEGMNANLHQIQNQGEGRYLDGYIKPFKSYFITDSEFRRIVLANRKSPEKRKIDIDKWQAEQKERETPTIRGPKSLR